MHHAHMIRILGAVVVVSILSGCFTGTTAGDTGFDRPRSETEAGRSDAGSARSGDLFPVEGTGLLPTGDLARYMLDGNPEIDHDLVWYLARTFREQADVAGVNSDIAFALFCIETDFLRRETMGGEIGSTFETDDRSEASQRELRTAVTEFVRRIRYSDHDYGRALEENMEIMFRCTPDSCGP